MFFSFSTCTVYGAISRHQFVLSITGFNGAIVRSYLCSWSVPAYCYRNYYFRFRNKIPSLSVILKLVPLSNLYLEFTRYLYYLEYVFSYNIDDCIFTSLEAFKFTGKSLYKNVDRIQDSLTYVGALSEHLDTISCSKFKWENVDGRWSSASDNISWKYSTLVKVKWKRVLSNLLKLSEHIFFCNLITRTRVKFVLGIGCS